MPNQLDDFKIFLTETRGLVSWALGAGMLGAIAASFAGVEPPWPNAATSITCGAMLLVLMYVYLFHRSISKGRAQSRFKQSMALLVVSLLIYLVLFSLFVVSIPTDGSTIIIGFACTSEATAVYEYCSTVGATELAHSNFDQFKLWTKISVTLNRIALFGSWLLSFSTFIFACAIFVIFSRSRKV